MAAEQEMYMAACTVCAANGIGTQYLEKDLWVPNLRVCQEVVDNGATDEVRDIVNAALEAGGYHVPAFFCPQDGLEFRQAIGRPKNGTLPLRLVRARIEEQVARNTAWREALDAFRKSMKAARVDLSQFRKQKEFLFLQAALARAGEAEAAARRQQDRDEAAAFVVVIEAEIKRHEAMRASFLENLQRRGNGGHRKH